MGRRFLPQERPLQDQIPYAPPNPDSSVAQLAPKAPDRKACEEIDYEVDLSVAHTNFSVAENLSFDGYRFCGIFDTTNQTNADTHEGAKLVDDAWLYVSVNPQAQANMVTFYTAKHKQKIDYFRVTNPAQANRVARFTFYRGDLDMQRG